MDGAEAIVLAWIAVLCRVGGCFMLAPGLGSVRVPVPVRLLAAICVSGLLVPALSHPLEQAIMDGRANMAGLILGELIIGVVLGFSARCVLLAVQFAATLAAGISGLSGMPGVPMEDTEALSPLATILSAAAALAIMSAGLHIDTLKAVAASYSVIPPVAVWDPSWAATQVMTAVASTTLLAVRLAAPLIVYALMMNLSLGLVGRFAPQLQIYFASTGVVIFGALAVVWIIAPEWLAIAATAYADWVREGRY